MNAKIVSKAINAAVKNIISVRNEIFELKWKRTLGELLLLGVLILAFNIRQTESLYPPPTNGLEHMEYAIITTKHACILK